MSTLNLLRFFRTIEKKADLSAARSMGTPEPLMRVLKKIQMETENHYSRFGFKKLLQKISDYLQSFYYTHPSYDERIQYLKENF